LPCFPDRLGAVVAAVAVGGDAGVIEIGPEPGVGGMAVAAFKIGRDVVGRLAVRALAVMTNDAEAGHRQWNLRMIDGLRRVPGEHRVAGIAGVAGGRMRIALALRNRAVVAGHTAAHHLPVIEVHIGAKSDGVVAGLAVVAARYVIRGLRRCVVRGSLDVADPAFARRTLEHRIDMT
jgi:hypothetical protein